MLTETLFTLSRSGGRLVLVVGWVFKPILVFSLAKAEQYIPFHKNIIKAFRSHFIKNDNAKEKLTQFSGTPCITGTSPYPFQN